MQHLNRYGDGLKREWSKMKYIAALAAAIIGILFLNFLLSALVIKLICWAFGFTFTWKLAFGLWLIIGLLQSIFTARVKVDK